MFSITMQRINLGLLNLWVEFKVIIPQQKSVRITRKPPSASFSNQSVFSPFLTHTLPRYLESPNAEVLGNFRKAQYCTSYG